MNEDDGDKIDSYDEDDKSGIQTSRDVDVLRDADLAFCPKS